MANSWRTWLSSFAMTVTLYKVFKYLFFRRNKSYFKEKVVLITGASSGIGESLAHEFYKRGCKVVLCARRRDELERVHNDLVRKYPPLTVLPIIMTMDLTNIGSLEAIVEQIIDITGHIDILINNGGVSNRGAVIETSNEVFMNIMMVNYFGTVALTKAVLPHMVNRREGHIVFMSSVQGLIAIPHRAAYAASKHAIQAFSDSLRAEIAQDNINVSVVSPGYVKTAISLNALTGSGFKHGKVDTNTDQGYSPDYVAQKTAVAILKEKNEIVIAPLLHRAVVLIRCNFPSLYFLIMQHRVKNKDS
ncbi:hypothetical protein PPYR_01672 [Photinus pyralis]|uniref:Ketoreductase domain-containing protein n=1 Tax=Photinus pyralis TaxID=7054 RepID=A0A5N4B532_PHOPY|nr:dehydrogenase/reductase SDR family protein 7-like [Photinus pyralis]KAB0804702.1 hypothetical protein PPYR_01672 [Photinus pyralis]